MIWLIFGVIAVLTFLSVGRIVMEADPARARMPVRVASLACWLIGLVLAFTGKPFLGLALMGLGALGVGALSGPWDRLGPRDRSKLGERDRHGRPSGGGPHVEQNADGGSDDLRFRRRPGVMTEEDAYKILGLEPGASPEQIVRAHRSLMKKIHPDQGGSTELAARVNAAKDILVARRHD